MTIVIGRPHKPPRWPEFWPVVDGKRGLRGVPRTRCLQIAGGASLLPSGSKQAERVRNNERRYLLPLPEGVEFAREGCWALPAPAGLLETEPAPVPSVRIVPVAPGPELATPGPPGLTTVGTVAFGAVIGEAAFPGRTAFAGPPASVPSRWMAPCARAGEANNTASPAAAKEGRACFMTNPGHCSSELPELPFHETRSARNGCSA